MNGVGWRAAGWELQEAGKRWRIWSRWAVECAEDEAEREVAGRQGELFMRNITGVHAAISTPPAENNLAVKKKGAFEL